jgi:hypothetical protein
LGGCRGTATGAKARPFTVLSSAISAKSHDSSFLVFYQVPFLV